MSDTLAERVVRMWEAKLLQADEAEQLAFSEMRAARDKQAALGKELGETGVALQRAEHKLNRAKKTDKKRLDAMVQDEALKREIDQLQAEIARRKEMLRDLDARLTEVKAYHDVMAASELHNRLLACKDEILGCREQIEDLERQRKLVAVDKYDDPKVCTKRYNKAAKRRRKLKQNLKKAQLDYVALKFEYEECCVKRREVLSELDLAWKLAKDASASWMALDGSRGMVIWCTFWDENGERQEKTYEMD